MGQMASQSVLNKEANLLWMGHGDVWLERVGDGGVPRCLFSLQSSQGPPWRGFYLSLGG